MRPEFDLWVGKIPWRRERLPTPVFWPGEFHGLYSPWDSKGETQLSDLHFHFQCQQKTHIFWLWRPFSYLLCHAALNKWMHTMMNHLFFLGNKVFPILTSTCFSSLTPCHFPYRSNTPKCASLSWLKSLSLIPTSKQMSCSAAFTSSRVLNLSFLPHCHNPRYQQTWSGLPYQESPLLGTSSICTQQPLWPWKREKSDTTTLLLKTWMDSFEIQDEEKACSHPTRMSMRETGPSPAGPTCPAPCLQPSSFSLCQAHCCFQSSQCCISSYTQYSLPSLPI